MVEFAKKGGCGISEKPRINIIKFMTDRSSERLKDSTPAIDAGRVPENAVATLGDDKTIASEVRAVSTHAKELISSVRNHQNAEEEEAVPFNPEFIQAIEQHFGNYVNEVSKFGVFLVMGGCSVQVSHNRIEINTAFELGLSANRLSEEEPILEDIVRDFQRMIHHRDALLDLQYVVTGRGSYLDRYYEHSMAKDVVFDSTETVIQKIQELKSVLEKVSAENSAKYSNLPPPAGNLANGEDAPPDSNR